MIHVVTYLEVHSRALDEAVSLLRDYRASSRAQLLQEIGRRNRFVIVESLQDETALEQREAAEYTTKFRARLKAIQNSPYDQRLHTSFAVADSAPGRAGAIYVVTHVDVPPPRREETEAVLRKLVEESRRDQGNLRFDIFQQNAPRTNHFTVLSVWSDEDAFTAYESSPHTRQFREALGPMLGAPYDERLFKTED
jgi:quinol monooxygenase YgiN